jgi:hypothetical protein
VFSFIEAANKVIFRKPYFFASFYVFFVESSFFFNTRYIYQKKTLKILNKYVGGSYCIKLINQNEKSWTLSCWFKGGQWYSSSAITQVAPSHQHAAHDQTTRSHAHIATARYYSSTVNYIYSTVYNCNIKRHVQLYNNSTIVPYEYRYNCVPQKQKSLSYTSVIITLSRKKNSYYLVSSRYRECFARRYLDDSR